MARSAPWVAHSREGVCKMIQFDTAVVTSRDLTGEFESHDPQVLQRWINDAITEVYEHIPHLDALVTSGHISIDSVEKLVAKSVMGALRNIDGFRSESEGDYSYSRYGDGFVWIRQSDIDRLLRRKSTTSFGTIRVGRSW